MTLHVLQTKLRHVLPEKLKLRRSSHSETDYSSITNHENATAGNSISLLLATRILQPSGLSASSFSAMMDRSHFISFHLDFWWSSGRPWPRKGAKGKTQSQYPPTHTPLAAESPLLTPFSPYFFYHVTRFLLCAIPGPCMRPPPLGFLDDLNWRWGRFQRCGLGLKLSCDEKRIGN